MRQYLNQLFSPREDRRCVVIAEVAQAHDGSLGTAHAFVDAVKNAGADGIKFQTHIASAESTPQEPWRVRFSPQDATRYDYWKRMEFTEAEWIGLKDHAEDCGLLFLSSPFSIEAVELLTRVGVAAWKVASGEINNGPMFERMAATGLPFLISTGMSTLSEIDDAVERVKGRGIPFTLLQCTSAYPTPAEQVGLNNLALFRERFGCPAGLSDHSGTIYPSLAAATLGADVLEVHVTLSRETFGPDVKASVTTGELRQLVDGVRFVERMLAHPIDKNELARELEPLRQAFFKSVVARENLPEGTILTSEHVTLKKPGTGIPAERLDEILGRRLRRPVEADAQLFEVDLETVS